MRGRRKGKGTKGQVVPLASAGLDALRRFDELDWWGCVQYFVSLKIASTCVCEVGPERPQTV